MYNKYNRCSCANNNKTFIEFVHCTTTSTTIPLYIQLDLRSMSHYRSAEVTTQSSHINIYTSMATKIVK